MRQTSDADAESWVLTTEPGRALLDMVTATSTYGPTELQRWRRGAEPDQVAAAVRLAVGRARGSSKFTRAKAMWFEPVGLEQATTETVARHKAGRFRGSHLLDLCCGIGGDTLALASEAQVVAVDADQGMCRRTRWNAQVYDVAERVDVIRAQAERIAYPSQWLVHVDPDRRQVGSKRARDLLDYSPGLAFLQTLPGRVRGGAIKLGPASDFVTHFGEQDCELELISLGGECKKPRSGSEHSRPAAAAQPDFQKRSPGQTRMARATHSSRSRAL
ncbi:class I SAM-dependent methyltransferase [Singulisphaera sp. Ch08]|uniref:Class I SAM-dependent methyltransferase n=1 Tax=Singulisphaera sp. Ch08 TaxID=3120278 RepID=A0AAU7CSW5_9BACT